MLKIILHVSLKKSQKILLQFLSVILIIWFLIPLITSRLRTALSQSPLQLNLFEHLQLGVYLQAEIGRFRH